MTWTTAQQQGFALGATLASDRGGALGARGLARGEPQTAAAFARELADTDREGRRAWVARALGALHDVPVPHTASALDGGVPPRALALLATAVPRAVGERWLAGASLPRAGYAPEPALRRLLARLIARAAAGQTARKAEPA